MINLILTWALHIGQVLSLSNQVATHSSQNICLQCSIVASCKLSWQIGQIPPHVFKSSVVGFIPYCWKLISTLKNLWNNKKFYLSINFCFELWSYYNAYNILPKPWSRNFPWHCILKNKLSFDNHIHCCQNNTNHFGGDSFSRACSRKTSFQ